jgi:flagellar hook-basal body complex protein FliE
MNVNGINASSLLNSITPQTRASGAAEAGGSSSSSFGSAVRDAVESLERGQKNAETEIGRAVTGESPDLHRTIVALQTADLSFQFALQVRNKLVGAYEEIMRMQV